MYVIMDLEWAYSKSEQAYPTQIAAVRVDSDWRTVDSYSSLITQKHGSLFDFAQVGYSGHEKAEFASAATAKAVFFSLLDRLKDDDILCWWQAEAAKYFEECCYEQTDRCAPQQTLILRDYVYAFISGSRAVSPNNPYDIAKTFNIAVPGVMHESMNDVTAIVQLLSGIDFPQRLLTAPPNCLLSEIKAPKSGSPYIADITHGIVHKSSCGKISLADELREYQTLQPGIRRQYKPCDCCKDDYRAAYRKRNEDIIARSEYNYIFTPGSHVFHKYTCGCMRNVHQILGSIQYETALRGGRVPCKLCNPSSGDTPRPDAYAAKKRVANQKNSAYTLGKKDKQAIGRYERAKAERMQAASRLSTMNESEKRDHITLTQPSFVFWAATGYSTFHTRNCTKMNGLKGLKGFSKYSDAVRAGYAPCKCCKPTAKMDMAVSIPLSSKERDGDSPELLVEACKKNGYDFSHTGSAFTLETPVGIWRIDMKSKPFSLHHINLAMTPNNRSDFHRQPKMFLSLMDAVTYIKKHDDSLLSKINAAQGVGSEKLLCAPRNGWYSDSKAI